MQQHKSILLGMITELRPNVSTFDPNKPIVIIVLYFYHKRINSIFLIFDDSLGKDKRVSSEKR